MVIKLRSGKLTRVMKEAGVEDARKKPKVVKKTSTKKAPQAKKPVVKKTSTKKAQSKCSSGMKFIGGKCRKVTEIIGREAK